MDIKKGPIVNLLEMTRNNKSYRKVRYTSEHLQVVTMCLMPFDFIKKEIHCDHDQFFFIIDGKGYLEMNNVKYPFGTGDSFVVPAKSVHYIENTSSKNDLKLITIYSPPEHSYDKEDIANPDIASQNILKMKVQ
jgi:mannose-6-phosphate isomerase-like protein (cupin superfamily)